MGRVVALNQIRFARGEDSIAQGAVTAGDLQEFAADVVRLEAGQSWHLRARSAADTYLFVVEGEARIRLGDGDAQLRRETFVTLPADADVEITALGQAGVDILRVVTPLHLRPDLPGFAGTAAVAHRSACPVVPIPEEHKQRIYFCGHHGGAYTERGHAMIVVYDGETHTKLHHHPDAESMFVLLDGACEFTVNGAQVVVTPGQAAYFAANDRHGLKTAAGHAGASFLEFHIPAKFSTVKA